MLTKILLTIVVIAACLWVVSSRRDNPKIKVRTVASKSAQQRQKLLRSGAWVFMGLMVLAATTMILLEPRDKNTIVTVQVVNTQSGERISYQARREDIRNNSFVTLAGRRIFTAGVERIEIEASQ